MKTCTKCGEEKVEKEFRFRDKQKNQRRNECKECAKEYCATRYRENPAVREKIKKQIKNWHEARPFSQTLSTSRCLAKRRGYAPCVATEAELASAFTGKCQVCGVPEMECTTRLHMDHCHETGKFRGWLCAGCNTALGLLGNSPERTLALAEYIECATVTIFNPRLGEERCF